MIENANIESLYSPRRRGWTYTPSLLLISVSVFPAEAGVNPCPFTIVALSISIPRGGGGEPRCALIMQSAIGYSPRRRGWTCRDCWRYEYSNVFPAEAGVNLTSDYATLGDYGIPRGGGGEPDIPLNEIGIGRYSPRRRGWTWYNCHYYNIRIVFPAEAGVNLKSELRLDWSRCIPRGGGGEPERVDKVETKI